MDVYFVLRNDNGTQTNCTFLIDGEQRGSLFQVGNGGGWIYNFLAFTIGDLPDTQHTLTIKQGAVSLLVFDRLSYTKTIPATTSAGATTSTSTSTSTSLNITPTSQTSTSRKAPNVGAIAGGVVGGVVFLLVMLAASIYLRRKRSQKVQSSGTYLIPAPSRHTDNLSILFDQDVGLPVESPYYPPQNPVQSGPQTSQTAFSSVAMPVPPSRNSKQRPLANSAQSYTTSPVTSTNYNPYEQGPRRQVDGGVSLKHGDFPPAYPK